MDPQPPSGPPQSAPGAQNSPDQPSGTNDGAPRSGRKPLVRRSPLAEPLLDDTLLQRLGLTATEGDRVPLIIELNVRYKDGLPGAQQRFNDLYNQAVGTTNDRRDPEHIASIYVQCALTRHEMQLLLRADAVHPVPVNGDDPRQHAIHRIWPDFPVLPLTDRSTLTVKADAARRAFNANGSGVTWAVVDSGIDEQHPHFHTYQNLGDGVETLHRDFTDAGASGAGGPLIDGFGHGTHVAGIIAGCAPSADEEPLRIFGKQQHDAGGDSLVERTLVAGAQLAGMAPNCKLVSLKVLDDTGRGATSNVLKALAYVREILNGNGKLLQVHGVNLSLGYEFDPRWYACGQSPLCVEVNRLVRAGVVVVVAAGNTGYGMLNADERTTGAGLPLTINDPGNAELAVTVGATHRDEPHIYGVSYFSSKGPTGDGRNKPDLVAPGECITSCAAGRRLESIGLAAGCAAYIDDSGTSMAAPHVAGVIAAFLSVRGEYLGQPEEIKRIFLEGATSLGRDRDFQGYGLVDLARTIQSV